MLCNLTPNAKGITHHQNTDTYPFVDHFADSPEPWLSCPSLCNIEVYAIKPNIDIQKQAIKNWCQNKLLDDFFREIEAVLVAYGKVINWAISKKDSPYLQRAVDEFLDIDEADA